MPSTTSTLVSVPLASSTVITPSVFTFFIASAINDPITLSLFAEIDATCSILSYELPTSWEILFMFFTISLTALSIPLLRSIGLAPAATFFRPAFTIACANTVAVVVPSPAISAVLEATSLTICAPIFSIASSNSISFATVTPSLVIEGPPNFLSITTFLPLGPNVTLTAFANASTPFLSESLASVLNVIFFAMFLFF